MARDRVIDSLTTGVPEHNDPAPRHMSWTHPWSAI